jgi:hypothetical protein
MVSDRATPNPVEGRHNVEQSVNPSEDPRPMRQPKVLISLAVLLVIGLHAVPVLSNERHQPTRWPILRWAMYKNPRPPGPIRADLRRIIALTAKGEGDTLTPKMVGLSRFALSRTYVTPMLAGDSAAARQLFGQLNRQRDDPFVEFRLHVVTYTLTDTGIVKEAQPDISYRADPSASK